MIIEPYPTNRTWRVSAVTPVGRPNMVKGDALVVHRAYGSQRAHEDEAKWLDYYKKLSENI